MLRQNNLAIIGRIGISDLITRDCQIVLCVNTETKRAGLRTLAACLANHAAIQQRTLTG